MMFCRIYQWRMEKELDDDGKMSSKTEKHLQKCSGCRTFYHTLTRLDTVLKRSASYQLPDSQLQTLSDSLIHHLSFEHHSSDSQSVLTPASFPHLWKIAATVLIAAALLTAGHRLYLRPDIDESDTPPFGTPVLSGSMLLNESYKALVSLPEKSVLSEFQKLTRDAQDTSAFLLSCVPVIPSQPPSPPPQTK